MPVARSCRRAMLAAAVLLVLGPAGVAVAHEADQSASPFIVEIDAVEPVVTGWQLVGDGTTAEFEVHADPGVVVEVPGYQGEPYLKIDAEGTAFVNLMSPSHWNNVDPAGMADEPAGVSVDAEPQWEWVSSGGSVSWHDHRIHWMVPDAPDVSPGGVVAAWTLPVAVGGTAVVASGTLRQNPDVAFEDYAVRVDTGHDMSDGRHDGMAEDGHGDMDEDGSGVPLPVAAGFVAAVTLAAGAGFVAARKR